MKVYRDLDSLPAFTDAVVTIGSFDGAHKGHQKIIEKIKDLTLEKKSENVLITFHPHPRQVLLPSDDTLRLLTTLEEKIFYLSKLGVDNLVVVPFTHEFASQPPESYIQDFLLAKFNPSYIVIGYDHKFGKDREGGVELLHKFESLGNFKTIVIEKQESEKIAISSSKVRKAIDEGKIRRAQKLLGHPYMISGQVVKGKQLGKQLGFPTANVAVSDPAKLIPPHGIYAVRVYIEKHIYNGMLYIGDRPTLEDLRPTSIEVNIFDFEKDIYDQNIQLELIERIRDDKHFDTLEELKKQLILDKVNAGRVISARKIPEVAVVLLNYNGEDHLKRFVPTLIQHTSEEVKLVVIDNASSDNSIEWLKENHPRISIIKLDKNHGFAEGYNLGIQEIESKYFVLLNSDVEVTENWIEPIIEWMESNPDTGACQPKVLSLEDKRTFEYSGASGGFIDRMGYPFCRGRIFDHIENDNHQYDDNREIFWASGCALFIRSEAYKELGGLDKMFFAHFEEIDLCWRIKRAGYNLYAIPESVVYHLGGGTLGYNNPRKTFLNFRNSLVSLYKNTTGKKWLLKIFARLCLDGIAGIQFMVTLQWANLFAVITAHWSFILHFSAYRKRKRHYDGLIKIHSIGPDNSRASQLKGSIVWHRYIRGIKKFTDLGNEVF